MVNIFTIPLVSNFVLPFLLVFVLVFAILQKSKVLGDGKTQIDSLVALAIALLLIITPVARDFVVNFTPWVAVGISVILVFLLLYGFVAEDSWKTQKWVKVVFGILSGLFVLGLVIYFSEVWKLDILSSWGSSESLWGNVILLVIVGGALAVALSTKTKDSKGKDK